MSVYSFGPFRLNASKRLLEKDGAPIVIGGRNLDRLIALIDRTGAVGGVRKLVANICRRLDGIALAIEMVGSRVGIYRIHGTVDLLDNGAKVVLQECRDALPRHQCQPSTTEMVIIAD